MSSNGRAKKTNSKPPSGGGGIHPPIGGKTFSMVAVVNRRRRIMESSNRIGKQAIKRLARKAQIPLIRGDLYKPLAEALRQFGKVILKDTIAYTRHSKRRTINHSDLAHAAKKYGLHLIGK